MFRTFWSFGVMHITVNHATLSVNIVTVSCVKLNYFSSHGQFLFEHCKGSKEQKCFSVACSSVLRPEFTSSTQHEAQTESACVCVRTTKPFWLILLMNLPQFYSSFESLSCFSQSFSLPLACLFAAFHCISCCLTSFPLASM